MATVTIKGVNYIAGMRWLDMQTMRPKKSDYIAALREQDVETKKPEGVFILSDSKSNAVFGYVPQEEERPKGKIYSLAATLAKDASNGIYITQLEGSDGYWMFAAKDSVVSPNTDVFLDQSALRSRVDMITSMMPDLRIFSDVPFFVEKYAADTWNIHEAISQQKPVLISLMGSSATSSPWTLVAAVSLISAVAGGYYLMTEKPKKIMGPTPEEQAALDRAAYVSNLNALTANTVTLSSSWVDEALSLIESEYVVNRYGWSFSGANCQPSSCNLLYSIQSNENPRSIESFAHSLGKTMENVVMSDGGATLQLGVPLSATTAYETLTEDSIRNLVTMDSKKSEWSQFFGMASLRLPKSKPNVDVTVDDYTLSIPPPADMPGVNKGTIVVNGENARDLIEARRLVSAMNIHPNRLVISFGTSQKQKAAWYIEYSFFGKK